MRRTRVAGDELTDEFTLAGCLLALLMLPAGFAAVFACQAIGHLLAEDAGFLTGFVVGTAVVIGFGLAAWNTRYRLLVLGLYVGWILAAAVTAAAVVAPES